MFLTGFWLGLGTAAGVLLAVAAVWWLWGWLRRPVEGTPEEAEETDDFTEDPRPDWMKARSRGPYDPTAGYVAKRGKRRRGEITNHPE